MALPSFTRPWSERTPPGSSCRPTSSWTWSEGGGWRSCCLCPLTSCVGLKDGPAFALQNSKPDSLLKMEEEQKLEKPPGSGNKDTKFSFSFSNKKLLGYVVLVTGGLFPLASQTHAHSLSWRAPR